MTLTPASSCSALTIPTAKMRPIPPLRRPRRYLENRGNTPRLFRNTLVFLAVDHTRLQDLDEAVRRYLAWESIFAEQKELDLTAHQVKQAEGQTGFCGWSRHSPIAGGLSVAVGSDAEHTPIQD